MLALLGVDEPKKDESNSVKELLFDEGGVRPVRPPAVEKFNSGVELPMPRVSNKLKSAGDAELLVSCGVLAFLFKSPLDMEFERSFRGDWELEDELLGVAFGPAMLVSLEVCRVAAG